MCESEIQTKDLINKFDSDHQKKPYIKPSIIHELELEVHAGSPIESDPLDLLPKE